jgi:hypothetical protein
MAELMTNIETPVEKNHTEKNHIEKIKPQNPCLPEKTHPPRKWQNPLLLLLLSSLLLPLPSTPTPRLTPN